MNTAMTSRCATGLACLAATPVAPAAQVQTSSVVVFGIVDSAARPVRNEGRGSIASLVSGANATSRLGLRATLSLVSKSLGELRLGRHHVPSDAIWSRHDPFSEVGAAGLVAFGEGGAAANGQHKVLGWRLGEAAADLGVSAAYTRSENDLSLAGPIKDAVIAGQARLAGVRLPAAHRSFTHGQAKQTHLLLGAVLPVGARVEVKASWRRVDMRGRVGATAVDANDARQTGLGDVHSLSKRTVLYATHSRIDNDGEATFVVPGGPAGIAGGRGSTGVEAGVRHTS